MSSEAGPGQQSGASHTTELTNHVAWTGEESEARKGRWFARTQTGEELGVQQW